MKRMLINATQKEELRVALVDGQKLYDLDIEAGTREQKKANIYKGKITRVEPSLEAAFVDFGAERHGFLPLKEIANEYLNSEARKNKNSNIRDLLKEGTEVIVQVDKEERGNKGAALTTFVSLAGRYLVLMPNNGRAGGISRRIEGEDRDQLKQAMSDLTTPKSMGVIVRTAGVGRSSEELQRDLDYLVQFWESIDHAAKNRKAPFLIYQESNVVIRAVRDYLRQDIGEVLIDNPEVHQDALNFVRSVMPAFENKIKLYQDDIPLFNRYQIESQIETAFQREVKLPSGGSIVIDPTEALVSIDINSSKATKGGDIEETALQTNLEAAEEISRQLRLRDIGGLIVIDFIDMTPAKHQREVENRLRDSLELDRARIQLGKISRFGLMEMSRQRLRPSLGETRNEVCPRCKGQGSIRTVESLALSIMRLIEEEGFKDRTAEVRAICPNSVATYLLNEKRGQLADIERRNRCKIVIIPSLSMETPHFDVQRIRDDSTSLNESSYDIQSDMETEEEDLQLVPTAAPVREQAAVKAPVMPPPQVPSPAQAEQRAEAVAKDGFGKRLKRGLAKLFGVAEAEETEAPAEKPAEPKKQAQSARSDSQSDDGSQARKPRQRNSNRGNRNQKGRGNRQNGEENRAESKQATSTEEKADSQDKPKADGNENRSGERPSRSRNRNRNRNRNKDADGRKRDSRQDDRSADASGGNDEGSRSEFSRPRRDRTAAARSRKPADNQTAPPNPPETRVEKEVTPDANSQPVASQRKSSEAAAKTPLPGSEAKAAVAAENGANTSQTSEAPAKPERAAQAEKTAVVAKSAEPVAEKPEQAGTKAEAKSAETKPEGAESKSSERSEKADTPASASADATTAAPTRAHNDPRMKRRLAKAAAEAQQAADAGQSSQTGS